VIEAEGALERDQNLLDEAQMDLERPKEEAPCCLADSPSRHGPFATAMGITWCARRG
jgi:hypothetical protein